MRPTNLVHTSCLAICILISLIPIPINTSTIYTTSTRIARVYVDRCMDIVESGYYELIGDITGVQTGRNYCIRIFASNVVLDGKGYKLVGHDTTGIMVFGASNVTIRNLAVSGYAFGIVVSNSSHIVITNNVVRNFKHGIRVLYSELINITNSTIVNDRRGLGYDDVGIYVERTRVGIIKYNTVINNEYGCCGIMLNSSTLIVIDKNNLINRNENYYFDGIVLINSDSNNVLNNFIVNCTGTGSIRGYDIRGAGINLINSHNNLVAGNSIERYGVYRYGLYGIRISGSSGNRIEGNTISGYS